MLILIKRFIVILGLCCLVGNCTTTLKVLPVHVVKQGAHPWCWAAVSAMAVEFVTGVRFKACEIAEIFHQNNKACCLLPISCQHGLTTMQFLELLHDKLKLPVQMKFYKPDFATIQDYIWNNKLIIYSVITSIDYESLDSMEGHVVVINGYCRTNKTVFIIDPALGAKTIPYEQLNQLGEFLWMATIGD